MVKQRSGPAFDSLCSFFYIAVISVFSNVNIKTLRMQSLSCHLFAQSLILPRKIFTSCGQDFSPVRLGFYYYESLCSCLEPSAQCKLSHSVPTYIHCSRLSSSQGYSSFPIPAFHLNHPVSLLGSQLAPQHPPGSLSWPLLPTSSAFCASSLEPGVKPGVDTYLCHLKTMPSGWAM